MNCALSQPVLRPKIVVTLKNSLINKMNGKIQHAKFFGPVMDGTVRRIITKKAWWENVAKMSVHLILLC